MNLTIQAGTCPLPMLPPAVSCPDCGRTVRWMFVTTDILRDTGAEQVPVRWVERSINSGSPVAIAAAISSREN